MQTISKLNGRTVFECSKITLPALARSLKKYVDAPVIDISGLEGLYDVTLDVPALPSAPVPGSIDATRPADVSSDPGGVSIFTSIFTSIQKLCLKLERRELPIEHLTVEHVEKTPTES